MGMLTRPKVMVPFQMGRLISSPVSTGSDNFANIDAGRIKVGPGIAATGDPSGDVGYGELIGSFEASELGPFQRQGYRRTGAPPNGIGQDSGGRSIIAKVVDEDPAVAL